MADFFGINTNDFLQAFFLFLAAYFGSKHGTINGNGSK